MVELKKTYVIYFTDVDADTMDVSQMKPVAYTEFESYAKSITDFLNSADEEILRKYRYQELF